MKMPNATPHSFIKGFITGFVVAAVSLVGVWYLAPNFLGSSEFAHDGYVGVPHDGYEQGPEDCTEYEQYDYEGKYCYYECDSEEECEEIGEKIDAALRELEAAYGGYDGALHGEHADTQDIVEVTEVLYEVQTGENFVVVQGEENEQHKEIRTWVAAIIPDNLSDTYLDTLGIFYDEEGGEGAFVADLPNEKWEMFVNRDLFRDGEYDMVFVIVHEFAHILTLNSGQLDPSIQKDSCDAFHTYEGCAREHAYIDEFYERFWEDKGLGDFDRAPYTPEEFVTDYAAENIGEDIAESFTAFILRPRPEGSTVADQKVLFFYEYPELVTMRADMRKALSAFVRAYQR